METRPLGRTGLRVSTLGWENRDLRQLLWHRHRMVQARTRMSYAQPRYAVPAARRSRNASLSLIGPGGSCGLDHDRNQALPLVLPNDKPLQEMRAWEIAALDPHRVSTIGGTQAR